MKWHKLARVWFLTELRGSKCHKLHWEREKQIMCVWARDSTRVFRVHFNEKSSSYCVNSHTDITTLCYELQSSITACHMSLYGFFLSPFNWVIWHHSGTTSKRWHVCSIRYNANTRRRLNYLSFWIFFCETLRMNCAH